MTQAVFNPNISGTPTTVTATAAPVQFISEEQPVPPSVDGDGTRNFSRIKKVRFRIDHVGGDLKEQPEYFDGVPNLPALLLIEFVKLMDKVDESSDIADIDVSVFEKMIDIILTDDSAERCMKRMRDKVDPIGLDQFMDSMQYAMGEYGMRPTKSSEPSPSSPESPDDGTNSTPTSISEPVPTSAPSPQHDS